MASHKTLMLYHFRVCTHDVSRLRFIDFEDSGVYVELSFSPSSLSLAEDIIACMAEESVHVFRLGPGTETEDRRQGSQDYCNHGETLALLLSVNSLSPSWLLLMLVSSTSYMFQ